MSKKNTQKENMIENLITSKTKENYLLNNMNDIRKLITQKENRKLEFKEIFPTNEKIIKTAIAFSNSQGGDLIIGVRDDNSIVGIDESNIIQYEEIISNTIYDKCSSPIIPEIYSVRIKEKQS